MKEKVLKAIYDYYKETNFMPSIREVQKILKYSNINPIYKAFKLLEEEGLLIHNKEKRKWCLADIKEETVKVKVINEDSYIYVDNINDTYAAYKMENNNFIKDNILKNDYLVIKRTKDLNNYDLGLFKYNNEYHIMKYIFLDGFYMLSDGKSKEILNKIKIVGKVIGIQRKQIIKKRCI